MSIIDLVKTRNPVEAERIKDEIQWNMLPPREKLEIQLKGLKLREAPDIVVSGKGFNNKIFAAAEGNLDDVETNLTNASWVSSAFRGQKNGFYCQLTVNNNTITLKRLTLISISFVYLPSETSVLYKDKVIVPAYRFPKWFSPYGYLKTCNMPINPDDINDMVFTFKNDIDNVNICIASDNFNCIDMIALENDTYMFSTLENVGMFNSYVHQSS